MAETQMQADAVIAMLKAKPELYDAVRANMAGELFEQAFQLPDARLKNMTVGDVHQATALGNETPKKKKKTFAESLTEIGDGRAMPQVHEDDGVNKVDWSLPIAIIKAEPTLRQIFGWASVSTVEGKIIIDKQGDMIEPDQLEKAAYDFMLYSRAQGDMHQRQGVGRMIESMIFTKEKQEILKIDLGMEGWWVGFYVDADDLWAAHKRGERPEFSIGGKGRRISV